MLTARKQLRWGILFASAALAACTSDTLERKIEEALQSQVGPAVRYQVAIAGLRARVGEADRVQAIGYGVRPRHGPAIDRMQVDLYNVRYDRDRKELERADSSRAVVWVTDRDLAAYLETIEGVGDATVTFEGRDSATIRMRPSIAGIPMPPGATASVSGRMVGGGPFLRFEVSDVSAVGLHASEGMVRRITQLINPLVDLSELPLALEVSSVVVENRTVRIDATGAATSLPAPVTAGR